MLHRPVTRLCLMQATIVAMFASFNIARADCTGVTSVAASVVQSCQDAGVDCSCLANVAPVCQPTGIVLDTFIERGACTKFGKPGIGVRPRLSASGSYQTFEKGEIAAYSQWAGDSSAVTPGFVLSGALDGEKIDVEWGSTKPFSYQYYVLRWDIDDHSEAIEAQHEDDGQQLEVKSSGMSGRKVINTSRRGSYVIYVEGCEKTGFIFTSATCKQGWSHPVFVDHLAALTQPVPIPAKPSPVIPGIGILDIPDPVMLDTQEQVLVIARLCDEGLLAGDDDHAGEVSVITMLAQLQSANRGWSCPLRSGGLKSGAQMRTEINDAILKAVVVSQPGTDVGSFVRTVAGLALGAAGGAIAGALLGGVLTVVFGGLPGLLSFVPYIGAIIGAIFGVLLKDPPGDYDMRLTGLVEMVYRFPAEIDTPARAKLIDDLLTVRGPASQRKDFLWISGVPTPVLETENHLWMTESSRYITNNLLVDRYLKNGQPVPAEFDNDANGMTDWVLSGLQQFLVEDFYENNSRPYAPLVRQAIENLATLSAHGQFCLQVPPPGSPTQSRRCDVARAARNVLDFLASKFAASSNGLRRAAPFRRQPAFRDYPRLLSDGGDDLSWRYLAYTGGSEFLRDERQSRLMEWADGDLLQAFQSSYRPPVMVTDLLRTTTSATLAPLQRFRGTRRDADVVEIYYREPTFLISAGGNFDSGSGVAALSNGEDSWALPTTLMPTRAGNDYRDFVRITGDIAEGSRNNTCVGPGFACGLNPQLPVGLPAACITTDGNWTFINFDDNTPDCPLALGFYAAVFSEYCGKADCDARFGFFEAAPARNFPAYMAAVLALNKSWTYEYDKINVYHSPTGREITFVFNAGKKEWGIVDYKLSPGAPPAKPERRFDQWPIASGDIMTSPAEACVMVDNRHLKERLILDHTDVNHPRRTVIALPGRECTCPLPDRCISPRAQ